ncbi:MAG: transporter substrate-binding domain-containing protein [Oscillospiraceae bacterium]|nr:transporter substrate-binding domain-containing protein [Oscillospiraceae bacterium]
MKRILALVLALMMLIAVCAGCGTDSDSDLAYVQDKGELVIGYTVYEPMNYTDKDGNFVGFDTEFAEAVCKELGVEPKFQLIDWGMKVDEVQSKAIDCIWNGMTITDELKAAIDVSSPYAKNAQVIIIRAADKDKYTTTESLKGAKIVAEGGSAGEKVIKADDNLKEATFTPVTYQTDTLMEDKTGASDAAVVDITLAQNIVGEGTDYADLIFIENLELSKEEYGIGFRKDSDLCTKVNEIIEKFMTDGTLADIAAKYNVALAE